MSDGARSVPDAELIRPRLRERVMTEQHEGQSHDKNIHTLSQFTAFYPLKMSSAQKHNKRSRRRQRSRSLLSYAKALNARTVQLDDLLLP